MEYRHTKPLRTERPTGRTVQRRVKGTTKTEKLVEFTFHQPTAQSVSVAGTFNNWDPKQTPLTKDPQGSWKATVSLKPGHYQYRFVADGHWLSDPNARDSIPNEFGSTNSVIAV
jgi:1,4-alpha-glucan branching enzyme